MARALKIPKLPSVPRLPNRGQEPEEPLEDVFEEMTLQEHLEELRDRLVKTCVSIGLAFIVGLFLAFPLLDKIKEQANIPDDEGLDILSPTEPITTYMKVALYIAVGFAMPIIIWQLIGFLAPGLTRKEKRLLFTSLPFFSILFLGGAAYAFFFAAPRAFDFLSNFGGSTFEWSPQGNEIISFYLTLMIGLGLAFELPVVMFVLAKLNIVSPRRMRQYRRYAYIVILILSAVITPSTDPFNMAIVAIPLLALYELGILIARVFARPMRTAAAG